MGKGLQALDSLRCAVSLCPNHDYKKENDLCDIIEKELKALEIIKETPLFALYITYYEDAYEMIADRKGFRVNESAKELQEKFDLLKEIVL